MRTRISTVLRATIPLSICWPLPSGARRRATDRKTIRSDTRSGPGSGHRAGERFAPRTAVCAQALGTPAPGDRAIPNCAGGRYADHRPGSAGLCAGAPADAGLQPGSGRTALDGAGERGVFAWRGGGRQCAVRSAR